MPEYKQTSQTPNGDEKAPTPKEVEEAQKAEEEDEKLGGDSEAVDNAQDVHRPEQDPDVTNKETGLPSPSTR